jgi:hypothetical protein
MKFFFRLSIGIALLILGVISIFPASAAEYTSPQAMLFTYYNAINRQDYVTAYGLWLNPRQTYQNFSTGFAATARVEPYLGTVQATSSAQLAYIPGVLLGYQTNGSVYSYYGCFTAGYVGTNGVTWRITAGNFRVLTTAGVPSNAVIQTYLGIDCTHVPTSIPPNTITTTSNFAAPTMLVYYDAINRKDFATAYSYWLQPIPGPKPNGAPAQDYRPPFQQFQNGYANTAYVNIYFGDYNQGGASAGHAYLDGLLPAVLVGQQTDGSFASYYGCYVMGHLPNGVLGIVNGKFSLLANDVPTGDTILQYVNIDCTQLAIPN